MLLWLQVTAQTDEPNMDSILNVIREENKELYSNSYEETEEDHKIAALITAWQEGNTAFIIKAIDSAKAENALQPEYFAGMQLLLQDYVLETESKNILNIFNTLKVKYGKDAAVNKYLIGNELWIAQNYYEPIEAEKLTVKTLQLLANNELELEDESLAMLYSLRNIVLELEGRLKERDAFVESFYKQYPEALKNSYLLTQRYLGNYQVLVDAIKDTKDANPTLVMAAAQSHAHLKNEQQAHTFFDEILSRFDSPENMSRQLGGVPTVFEGGMEGSTSFLAEDVTEMATFYFNKKDKKQACLALEMLKATVASNEQDLEFRKTKNDYLKGKVRIALEKEAELKENTAKEKRSKQIETWQKLCK